MAQSADLGPDRRTVLVMKRDRVREIDAITAELTYVRSGIDSRLEELEVERARMIEHVRSLENDSTTDASLIEADPMAAQRRGL